MATSCRLGKEILPLLAESAEITFFLQQPLAGIGDQATGIDSRLQGFGQRHRLKGFTAGLIDHGITMSANSSPSLASRLGQIDQI